MQLNDYVVFGRGQGEQTVGKIVKVSRKTFKVQTLEARGRGRGSRASAIWTVGKTLCRKARPEEVSRAAASPQYTTGGPCKQSPEISSLKQLVQMIPRQPQRQDSLTDQIKDLVLVANRLGMYDAEDFFRNMVHSVDFHSTICYNKGLGGSDG